MSIFFLERQRDKLLTARTRGREILRLAGDLETEYSSLSTEVKDLRRSNIHRRVHDRSRQHEILLPHSSLIPSQINLTLWFGRAVVARHKPLPPQGKSFKDSH